MKWISFKSCTKEIKNFVNVEERRWIFFSTFFAEKDAKTLLIIQV
jgi:hypothetical protein